MNIKDIISKMPEYKYVNKDKGHHFIQRDLTVLELKDSSNLESIDSALNGDDKDELIVSVLRIPE